MMHTHCRYPSRFTAMPLLIAAILSLLTPAVLAQEAAAPSESEPADRKSVV